MKDSSPLHPTNRLNLPSNFTPRHNFSNIHPNSLSKKQLESSRNKVIQLKDSKNYKEALVKIEKIINEYSSDIRSYQLKGEITYSLKMYKEALETYDQLLAITTIMESVELTNSPIKTQTDLTISEIKRMRALYYYNRGLCLQKLTRHSEAVEAFKKSRQLNKSKIQTCICMAESFRALNKLQNAYKIYNKIIDSHSQKSEYLFKIIKICQADKQYQTVLELIEKGLNACLKNGIASDNQQVIIDLFCLKGDTLKKMEKYQEAISAYSAAFSRCQPNTEKLLKIYSKTALCYDSLGNLDKAEDCYLKILKISQNQFDTLNNLANLYIRRSQYQQALKVCSNSILKLLFQPSDQNFYQLVLLRCHRVVSFVRLGRISEASNDLSELMLAMDSGKLLEIKSNSEWQNYKFVKYIIDKYKSSLVQLTAIRNSEGNKNQEEMNSLQEQLICSISYELVKADQKQPQEGVNLQKLQHRIDRLYNEIINFKKQTLEQHQESNAKVHNRIVEIQQLLEKREEENNQLEQELDSMKEEHHSIYNTVQLLRVQKEDILHKAISQLKTNNKNVESKYIQQMYWVLNTYLIAIRLAANDLIPKPKTISTNKFSSFLSKFKQVFSTLSHIPHIGSICQGITATISIYLQEEANLVYQTLNRIISNNYFIQRELQEALEKALISLIDSNYISESVEEFKNHSIAKETNIFHKAYKWYKTKKQKLLEKIFKIETSLSSEQKMIEELVIEDISAILVFLIKNKHKYLIITESNPETLKEAFQKTLILGFKKKDINELYSKQTCKEVENNRKGQGCSKCLIYHTSVPSELMPAFPTQNMVMDSLLGDAIREKDLQLFVYALSHLRFNFK